jgi:multiple sugar transport system substrate-binding protein
MGGSPQAFRGCKLRFLPIAGSLPDHSKTPDFIARIWPTNMQRALSGEISPDDMMKAIDQHFNG